MPLLGIARITSPQSTKKERKVGKNLAKVEMGEIT
jgi:hypothetical protein